jgi:diguanylate cyclase (GGDEF)-like protein
VALTDIHLLHECESGRCWHHSHERRADTPRRWNRQLVELSSLFHPWLDEGGLPENLAAPPPWPDCVQLQGETDEGSHRLVVPIGRIAPWGFLVFNLPPGIAMESPPEKLPRFLLSLLEELPPVISRCVESDRAGDQLRLYQTLNAASMALQSCRDVATVAGIVTEALQRDFGFDVVALALVEGPIRLLRGYTVAARDEIDLSRIDFPLGTSDHPLAALTNEGGVVHAPRVEGEDPRVSVLGITATVWQAVWLPLIAKGEPVGLLIAFNREDRRELDPGALRVLGLLANHAALATETVRSIQDIENEAARDGLTGLYNRRHLDRLLEQEIRRTKRYGAPLTLLMIDLNDFKVYNDTHGHLAGDAILRDAATLIERNVRQTDLVARYGGDEFVVLMPNSTPAEARAATERIQSAVAEHRAQHAGNPARQLSLTIGHHVAAAESAETVLEAADRSMFDRKDDTSRRRLLDQLVEERSVPAGRHARLIFGLMKTLSRKDPGHLAHSRRVMGYALMICERLQLSPLQCEQIAMAAILHDVGRVVFNAEILTRRGPLTRAEQVLVRSHPLVAADLLTEMPFLEPTLATIRHHHERWDGRTHGDNPGYPDGLMGETIPLGSRIIRIGDTFDALTIDRPHRAAVSVAEAVEVLRREAGSSLDPNIVARSISLFERLEGPIDPDAVHCPIFE